MMPKTTVLNWYAKDRRMTRGLEDLFNGRGLPKDFITFRLGPKWADKLRPNQRVAISISDNPQKPKVVGYARVLSLSKKRMVLISVGELRKNIGVKNLLSLLSDTQSVYKPRSVSLHSVVSVIALNPI